MLKISAFYFIGVQLLSFPSHRILVVNNVLNWSLTTKIKWEAFSTQIRGDMAYHYGRKPTTNPLCHFINVSSCGSWNIFLVPAFFKNKLTECLYSKKLTTHREQTKKLWALSHCGGCRVDPWSIKCVVFASLTVNLHSILTREEVYDGIRKQIV